MIELKLFFALVSYYFVMFSTPGPNNAMLTASGIKFGFRKTIPHILGISIGHALQISIVCLGLGTAFKKFPFIQEYLKWVCLRNRRNDIQSYRIKWIATQDTDGVDGERLLGATASRHR